MQRFLSALPIRWALLLVTGLWSILAVAQSTCPELKVSDFKVNYYAANADCGTAGQIIVTYRNNVAGFSKLTYETSTDGATWANPVEQTSLSVPTTIPLTGWAAGQTIHLRVTGTCPSGTQEVTFPTLTHRSEQPHAVAPVFETTPAGGCSATAGSIDVSVGEVSGFTKAEYFLYQGTTLLNSMTSNTPYAESTFYNLPSGTYKVVMRATPACTPASPGATFKNGAYEVEQTVKVGYFSILPTPIPTRGTCDGGVRVAVARVMGVNSIKYELLPTGGHAAHAAALQTQQLTFPNFTHTFLGIPLGSYEIRATTDCGTVEVQPFSVTTGAAGTLTTKVVRNTYVGCNKGIITGMVPGTTDACPVNYTLTPKSYVGTPIVKNGITTESVTFDNLPTGYYEMEVSWGGQVQKHIDRIQTVSLGDLELSAVAADYACDPSGSITVKLKNGVYEEPMTLTLSLEGTPVRSVTLAATDREKTITNLVPGGYDISLKSECGNEIKGQVSVLYKNMPPLAFELPSYDAFEYDECEDQPYLVLQELLGSGRAQTSSIAYKKFMAGATYALYIDGTLASSGAMPRPISNGTWSNKYKIPVSQTTGKMELRIYPSCGSPMLTYSADFSIGSFGVFEKPEVSVNVRTPSTSCDALGEISVGYDQMKRTETYTLNIINTDTGNTVFTKTYTNTSYFNETINNLPGGHYKYEFYPACRENNKMTGTFNLNARSGEYQKASPKEGGGFRPSYTVYASCNGQGSIEYRFNSSSSGMGLTYKYRLVNSAGVEVEKREPVNRDVTFSNLAPDTYTLYCALSSPSCTEPEITFDPVTVPAGLPENALTLYQDEYTSTDFCSNTAKVKIRISPSTPGQYYVTSGTMHLLDPATGNDAVSPVVITDLTQPVSFTGINPGTYTVVLETACGKISKEVLLWTKSTPNFVKTHVTNVFPGCQKGKIKVIANPISLGYPDLPIKIELVKNVAEGQPEVIDVIKSSASITEHTFENVPAGRYNVNYIYCGTKFNISVEIKQITAISLQVNPQSPGPCETGTVQVSSNPLDASIELELKAKNKLTGIVEKTIMVNGGESSQITDLTPGQAYEISADIKGSCVQTSAKSEVTIPNANIYASINWSQELDCWNNGWIEMWLNPNTTGRITKVQYSIQPASGGTPIVAQTTNPTEHKKFLGLAPGKYRVQAIATCQFANGTISQYTWNNNGNAVELKAAYTTMTAYQNNARMRSTMACPPRGAIGLTIQGGNKYNRNVYVLKDPSGNVSPPRKLSAMNYSYDNDVSWGGDLAPGAYKIRIDDGCMTIDRDITVPEVQDLATFKNIDCTYTTEDCTRMRVDVTIDLSAYPNNALRCNLAPSYEVAVVPRGGDRTTEPWSSAWRVYDETANGVCSYAVTTDHFATIPYGNTADVLLRLKGCTSTMRRFPVTLKPCCEFGMRYRRLDCDRNQFYLAKKDICSDWDVVIVKEPWSGPVTEIYRKRIRFSGKVNEEYTDNDWIVPSNEPNVRGHYMYIYPAGSTQYLCYESDNSFTKDIRLKYIIEPQSTSCTWERYTWHVESDCPVLVKFKIWDTTTNTVVDESPGLMSDYKSNYHYVRNRKYHIRLYDAAGNELNFKPNGGSTPVSLWEHTVTYDTPVNYKISDITLNNSCGDSRTLWYLPTANFSTCEGIPAVYAAGVTRERARLPIINKIEIRHNNTGDVYYTDTPVWDQTLFFRYYCYGNVLRGTSWKVRRFNGIVESANGIPIGDYTLTVHEDCGVKTSTFKINDLKPAVIDLSYTASMDCQGKFTIKPTGTAKFTDRAETITFIGFQRHKDDDPTEKSYTWGQSYESYNPQQNLSISLKSQNSGDCFISYRFDLSRYYLSFDAASSASYFCTGSNKGDISIGLKGGNPPYTYKLLKPDGTLVEQKVANGGVNFQTGKLGEIYRIDATDNCGLTHIYQDVLLQDPKEIGYTMDRDYYFCEGEPSSFEAINLAGATYEWTGPNGFTSTNRVVNITATTTTAGTYNLKVKPLTCSTTINATVKVNVVKVKEVGTSVEKRLCSGQTVNINIGPSTALSNGTPATNHKYQWQITENPTDANSWNGIVGATSEQLNYTPPFQGTYYVRRVTLLGNCSDYSAVSKIVADPGLSSIVSNDELNVTIDHKNPFTLTAGFVTGNPTRTYQWQRSLNKTTWTNIAGATDQTYTETQRYGSIVYYKRITSAGTCSTESPIITVRFKKRYPAMVNPHLRQRVLTE